MNHADALATKALLFFSLLVHAYFGIIRLGAWLQDRRGAARRPAAPISLRIIDGLYRWARFWWAFAVAVDHGYQQFQERKKAIEIPNLLALPAEGCE